MTKESLFRMPIRLSEDPNLWTHNKDVNKGHEDKQ